MDDYVIVEFLEHERGDLIMTGGGDRTLCRAENHLRVDSGG